MSTARPVFDESTIAGLARVARLELSDERQAAVGPALTGIYKLVDQLDRVDLSDVPPATAFDARWE